MTLIFNKISIVKLFITYVWTNTNFLVDFNDIIHVTICQEDMFETDIYNDC